MQLPTPRLSFLVAAALAAASAHAADLRVRFLDVGQGDAVLIRTPGGKGWLIDGGPQDRHVTYAIIRGMRAERLKELEGVVITHPHIDHFGGLMKLVEMVPVKKVLVNAEVDAPTYGELKKRMKARGIAYRKVRHGRMAMDRDLDVRVLAALDPTRGSLDLETLADATGMPPAVYFQRQVHRCSAEPGEARASEDGVDLNDGSVVMKVSYGHFDLLLTGDATHRVEEHLLAKKKVGRVEVLKVAHHGSEYSSTAAFLKRVRPREAVIQVGRGNSYGHPHRPALARLKEVGARVWRNDRHGGILIEGRRDGSYRIATGEKAAAKFSD